MNLVTKDKVSKIFYSFGFSVIKLTIKQRLISIVLRNGTPIIYITIFIIIPFECFYKGNTHSQLNFILCRNSQLKISSCYRIMQ